METTIDYSSQSQNRDKMQKYWAFQVDWNKHDAELARELNLSRERIRQVRKSLGKPSSRLITKPRRFKVNLNNEDWSKSNTELAETHNLTPWSVSKQRSFFAPETKRKSLRGIVKDIDWSLTFNEINDKIKENYGITVSNQSLSRYKSIFAPNLVKRRIRDVCNINKE